VLLTALVEAADRVDSTAGVQMAYLKKWSRRSFNRLTLRTPALLPRAAHGPGRAWQLEARDAIGALAALPTDLVYLDPPYNQHKYVGNYHVWETIVLGDEPATYGVARKRVDCKTRRSDFNSVPRSAPALRETVTRLVDEVRGHAGRPPLLMLSFSNEGHVRPDALREMLEPLGHICQATWAHDRYIGARIGIHSPAGAVVGKVSHVRNTEHLFVVVPEGWPPEVVQTLQARAEGRMRCDQTAPTRPGP
jgi:adenine-specific DNA-methyltransferase